jgi:hypothetical protein
VHKSVTGAEKHHHRFMPGIAASGRLRIARTGSLLSTYYAAKDSDDFQLTETWPVGDSPIREIDVMAAASDAVAKVDVVVSQLTVQVPKSSP